MGTICVNDIRCHAYHGCMEEEAVIGTSFSVSVEVDADLSSPSKSDFLSDTIDYVSISKIVQEEMGIRSKLIEHVANRILNRLMSDFPNISSSKITLVKHNPPITGDVKSVSITMVSKR